MSELLVVPPEGLSLTIPKVSGLLSRALKRDPKQTWERVKAALYNNEALLILILENTTIKTSLVVEIHKYALSKSFHIWLCAGEGLDLLKTHLPQFENLARSYGCDRISYTGRNGFLRIADFDEVYVTAFRKI